MILISALLLFSVQLSFAQEGPVNTPSAGISYSFMGSDSQLPFFMIANRDGRVQPGAQFQHILGAWGHTRLRDTPDGISVMAGVETAPRVGDTANTFHFQQLYSSAEYRSFRLTAGRFYDTRGIYMAPLTMGSMTLSRNATPVPKIKLETTEYVNVPLTNGFFQFYATWSDGRLEEQRFISSANLHQKSLHLKLNIGRFDFIGGLDHNVVWGGRGDNLQGRFRSRSDYFRTVLGRTSDGSGESTGARLGNSVASYDFGINYDANVGLLRIYRTFFIETTAASRFRSPWDGVWGIGMEMNEQGNLFDAILYEHMNTIRQDAKNAVPMGRANYYNHAPFRSGWTYYGSVLGNPLIISDYNHELGEQPVINNMVLAHHIGVRGTATTGLTYTLFANYSRNYGLCTDRVSSPRCVGTFQATEPRPDNVTVEPRSAFREDRYSVLLALNYLLSPARGIIVNGTFTADRGAFTGSLNGIMIGLRWEP